MENGLNFGKAIEAAKAEQKVARAGMERSRNVRIHSSCITYYRRYKRMGRRLCTLSYGLKLLKKT
jgi:hypothetical protein